MIAGFIDDNNTYIESIAITDGGDYFSVRINGMMSLDSIKDMAKTFGDFNPSVNARCGELFEVIINNTEKIFDIKDDIEMEFKLK